MFVLLILAVFTVGGSYGAPIAKPRSTVSITKIHVIKGCSSCEAMQEWLAKGGVELDVQNVQQGSYALYPTVIYSDNFVDHGDRMYKQQVVIPQKICVVSCSVGMN
jgi:hypothetical protein